MDDIKSIDNIYQEFLDKLNSLSKKQDELIKEYGERLKEQKILQLKKEIDLEK